jgi:PAS domain S-box-containing protein
MDQTGTSAVPKPFRLLVAEADREIGAALDRILRPLGAVELVADGGAALESMRQRVPDLLLLDAATPGVDESGFIRALRADDRTRDLRVMILAARAGAFAGETDAIADDYLAAPFTPRELVARVRTQLLVCSQRAALRAAEAAIRRAEERFRLTVDNVPINIVLYSHDYRALYINPPLASICHRPLSEILGLRADELGPPEISGPLKEHIARAIATGERQSYELGTVPRGGTRVVKQWTVVPLAGADGDPPQVLVMSHDISAQRQLVEELRESDRRKSEFIAVLSHELRNPLAAIRTSLYVVGHAPASDAAGRALRVIDRQVGQLARMVDDLLDVTRITQNKVQLQRQPLDLNELVRQTIDDNRLTLERSGVRLDARFAGAPIYVNADGARIAQIVTNLLANAVKFTPTGGTVSVSIGADSAGERAVLSVRDTGTGIDPALLGRLFEPFMQADRTLDRTGGGLGLGLALVKGLVKLHEGDVNARSEGLGQGAEFIVRLPLATTAARGIRAAADDGNAARQRVLVIEDDGDVADGLQSALEIDEHQVVVARSGAEGLEAARGYHPDVVLCDIGLPGMNGYDVARAFRADDALRSTFLVALSGYAQAEDVDRARAAGFDEHLAKPPTIDKLKRIFAAAYDKQGPHATA